MMIRLLLTSIALFALSACGVPEVDLDLPDRSGPPVVSPSSSAPTSSAGDPSNANEAGPSSTGEALDPDELDELEQLVSEIEALLEGVSDELDQITFEEEGG